MAFKTITIDTEAYGLLARQKRDGQSFSEVIKGRFGRKKTASELLLALSSLSLERETLDRIEERIKDRRRHRAKAPRL